MLVGGDYRPVASLQSLFRVPSADELCHVQLGDSRVDRVSDEPECVLDYPSELSHGLDVGVELRGAPPLGRVLDQVRRRHDLQPKAADQLQRAGVHLGRPRQGSQGRVLHRDTVRCGCQIAEPGHHVVTADEQGGRQPEMREPPLVDEADQQACGALPWDPYPARARDVGNRTECVPHYRVHAPVVVEQPPVEVLAAHVLLGLFDYIVDGHLIPSRLRREPRWSKPARNDSGSRTDHPHLNPLPSSAHQGRGGGCWRALTGRWGSRRRFRPERSPSS